MIGLDIWMREHPIAYVLLGSYAIALVIFVAEAALARHRRKLALRQVRLMRDAGEGEQ